MADIELPNFEHTRYGRQIAEYDDCEGFVVAGHDRRSWAALLEQVRDVDRWYRVDPKKVAVRWVTFAEECGCTEAEHATHLVLEEDPRERWHDCTCENPGLRPCSDNYSWLANAAEESDPDATPILEWRW
jgi:hypothetical protein